MVSASWYVSESSSRIGATARHGAHHVAQKSTSTGLSAFRTFCSNVASLTSTVAIASVDPSTNALVSHRAFGCGLQRHPALATLVSLLPDRVRMHGADPLGAVDHLQRLLHSSAELRVHPELERLHQMRTRRRV